MQRLKNPADSKSVKNLCSIVFIAVSVIFTSVAYAGGDPDELLEADGDAIQDATGTAVGSASLGAAVEESSVATTTPSQIVGRVATALKPKESVPSLMGDRVTGYASEQAFSLLFERDSAKYGVNQGRVTAGFLFTEERDTVFQLGFVADAPTTLASSFRLSFGTRAYLAILGIENNDSIAFSLGVEAAYILPFKRLPLEFNASFYYAPDVLTFGQGERVIDTTIDVILPFRNNFDIFAGVRLLEIDLRPGDREIDNLVHGGLRYTFGAPANQ